MNRMHYKNVVSIVHYSPNFGCCRRSVAPWITVLSWHTVFTKRVIYYKFTLVWYSVKQGTMHRPTSHLVHLYTVPFLWPREEHRRPRSWVNDFAGQCLLWRLLSRKTFFCARTWSSNQSGGAAILALSSFLNQIPHQKEPEILVGIFSSWPLLTNTTACLI